jgi:hypothetical protein
MSADHHQLKSFQRISFEDLSALSAISHSQCDAVRKCNQSYGSSPAIIANSALKATEDFFKSVRDSFHKTIDNVFFETICEQETYAAMEKTLS